MLVVCQKMQRKTYVSLFTNKFHFLPFKFLIGYTDYLTKHVHTYYIILFKIVKEILNHFNFLYSLNKNDWEFKGWCGCCKLREKLARKPEDIEAPPKIAYDEQGDEVELIETMKLLPINNVENSRDPKYKGTYVAEVTLVHPESHILRAFMDQKTLYRKLLHARAMYKSYDETSIRHNYKKAQRWLAKADRLKIKHQAFVKRFERNAKEVRVSEKDVHGAFVIFNHEESCIRCLADYKYSKYTFIRKYFQPPPLRFRGRFTIKVERADNPTNIQWVNIDTNKGTVRKRKCITAIITFILLVIALIFSQLCHTYGKSTNNKYIKLVLPFVVVVMNNIVRICLARLAKYERHHSEGEESVSVSIKTTLALVLNTALTPLVLYANFEMADSSALLFGIGAGEHNDFTAKWYATIGSGICTTMLLSIITSNIYPVYEYLKNSTSTLWSSHYAVTQDELDRAYTGWNWKLEYRVPVILNFFIVCLMFSTGMPILYVIGACAFGITYMFEKFTLLNVANRHHNTKNVLLN